MIGKRRGKLCSQTIAGCLGCRECHAEDYSEKKIKNADTGNTNKIDVYIHDTHIVVEQKGMHVDLRQKERQSDGTMKDPYEQARDYHDTLGNDERDNTYLVTCNFQSFLLYDMSLPDWKRHAQPQEVLLKDLPDQWKRLRFLVDNEERVPPPEELVSIQAGKLIGRLYDALLHWKLKRRI